MRRGSQILWSWDGCSTQAPRLLPSPGPSPLEGEEVLGKMTQDPETTDVAPGVVSWSLEGLSRAWLE